MGGVVSSLMDALFAKHLELVLVGLDGAGKSTLINVLCAGAAGETAPTVGLEVRQFRKGNLKIKAWDLAGGSSYRQEWSRYARGVDCIVFVLDAADPGRLASARKELHRLLEDNALAHTPLLVCANKVDLVPHLSEEEVVKGLNLDYVMECVGGQGGWGVGLAVTPSTQIGGTMDQPPPAHAPRRTCAAKRGSSCPSRPSSTQMSTPL